MTQKGLVEAQGQPGQLWACWGIGDICCDAFPWELLLAAARGGCFLIPSLEQRGRLEPPGHPRPQEWGLPTRGWGHQCSAHVPKAWRGLQRLLVSPHTF